MTSKQLKLWKISMDDDKNSVRWDFFDSHIICAYSETQVREIAAENPGDEGKKTWLDDQLSYIQIIATDTTLEEVQIIMSSFNAG